MKMEEKKWTPGPPSERVSVPREPTPEMLAIGRNAFPGICGVMSGSGIDGQQPFGLYDEERTLQRVRAIWRRMVDAAEGVELYRPCNGLEGDAFMSRWCRKCARDNFDENTGDGGCEIIAYTFALDEDDADYPRAWRQDGGQVRCTAFEPREAARSALSLAEGGGVGGEGQP